ncbi:nitric oxide dioxygenase [Aeromonas salmonicida]|uniref:Flavohemoprotein n=2 Tax=Gammaproteobacteria TaxID=1236 RepID=A0A3L0VS80_ECOLX|nr:NO-inducible flavohemoprotein [Aeromonas salmonicida]ATP08013.1 nitric oxide dioxygenase [Aeromonas salmonicida subsp. pectinolytica 34mel]EQC05184.1 flavohemoprotein [Aeromonas salmonicida subsp. pectinolytica 34mel]TNI21789.1 nitric oxide dioxygenase [Aeromonas salmonicida]HEH9394003.1 NO-inducible flavohemoprotein [Aeromonas salmonicida]HEH9407451.1 NO-inducible flavohemoprotein [Aeromonas salmonicida]
MLDQATIAVIKSTIPLLESAGPALTQHFYQRMFSHNPELKDIFNLAHQRSGGQPLALFNAVAAYAKNIDNLGALAGAVERIAHKHTGFMIQPEQYHIVGSHLLATLKELGGSAVTDEVLDAWGKAYGVLASIFIGRESEIYQEKASEIGGWQGPRPFIIKEKRVESELITSFMLAPIDGKPVLHFKPGQYLSIQLNHPELEYQEIRQYSLSDAPNGRDYRISVKREPQGQVSNLLHDHLQVGDKVDLMPPTGDFFLQASASTPVVLLSAGVGLTPMLSMLNQLLSTGHDADVCWLHACERGSLHAFKEDIQRKRQQHHKLQSRVWYREPSDRDEQGKDYDFSGTMDLSQVSGLLVPQAHYYFCGPLGFMQGIKTQLSAAGIPTEQLHYEVFGPHQDL